MLQENLQILRDYSLIFIQLRNYEGYLDARYTMLQLRPTARANWASYAIALHMLGKYDQAVAVIDAFIDNLKNPPAARDYEHSEFLLYKAQILDEAGHHEKLLDFLKDIEPIVADGRSLRELVAKSLLHIGRNTDAEERFRCLIKENPDNYQYLRGLEAAVGLRKLQDLQETQIVLETDEQRKEMLDLYRELTKRYPRSKAIQRTPLQYVKGVLHIAAHNVKYHF